MRRRRASVRIALAVAVLALVLLAAGATAAGYLVEAHNQRTDRAHRLAAAAAYLEHGATPAGTTRWQQTLTRHLTSFGLRAELTLVWPGGKRVVYASNGLTAATTGSAGRPAGDPSVTAPSSPSAIQPTATYLFPVARGSGEALTLDLYAPSPDRTRPVLVALASGLAALLAGAMLLSWAASHWPGRPASAAECPGRRHRRRRPVRDQRHLTDPGSRECRHSRRRHCRPARTDSRVRRAP